MTDGTQIENPIHASQTPAGRNASTDRFLAVVAEVIGIEKADKEAHFLDVGGDSLSAAIFIDWIAQEFGVEPELDWFFDSASLQELADRWWARVQEQAPPAEESSALAG